MTGILAYGAYIPQLRLQRSAIHAANGWFAPGMRGLAKGARAMANWDEDAITLGVEAARDALEGVDRARIGTVMLASTTLPFADRQNAGIVKEALNLADTTQTMDMGGSLRAGVTSLLAGLRMASDAPVLNVSADLRKALPGSEGEMTQGDAAAAFVLGEGDALAVLKGSHSVSVDFVDHYRAHDQDTDYTWESRWIRDEGFGKIAGGALVDALAKLGLEGSDVDRLLVPIHTRGVPESLAKRAGIAAEAVADTLAATVGNAGTAHPGLLLAAALDEAGPGETIVLLGFGQGCEVLVFETTDRIGSTRPRMGVSGWLARGKAEENYMKFLFFRGHLPMEIGIRGEHDERQPLTALWRRRKTVLGLVGGKCSKTGTVQFPKTELSVNPNDHAARTQEDYPLADIPARVMTYTADSLTFTPDPPQYYGNIEFEGGGRMVAEFADVDPEAVEVGQKLRMVFRIKGTDERRHYTRYFWKAAPAD